MTLLIHLSQGVCPRGRTCPYKHDSSKVAICWPFLQNTCQNTAETCPLSHDPTPERTPLCVHFSKNGRCKNGDNCLFPHVHVEPRHGVCRDFAVLGYCERGINCNKQHVRECPDFAERGSCPNSRCRLPHVIRANQRRSGLIPTVIVQQGYQKADDISDIPHVTVPSRDQDDSALQGDADIGAEYISLTFHESEESEDETDSEEDSEVQSDDEGEGNVDMTIHI